MKKYKKIILYAFVLLLPFLILNSSLGGERTGKTKSDNTVISTNLDAYRLAVNRLSIPINSKGIIADVNIDGRAGGEMDGKIFLYSSGFFLSGINSQGLKWFNAVASASRIEDYVPGTIEGGSSSGGLYVVKASDEPFGTSWTQWKTAVESGAYFYDGDGDGVYDPIDKNGNGIWDPDEDAPDLLGDETVWCVYNDGLPSGSRAFSTEVPQGIEIRQTVWGYATSGDLGQIIFVRYSLLNTGTLSAEHDSVFFGVWADPDLGDPYDDLVGCDTDLNAGFVYNDGADTEFGSNPPAFLIDFFQGPWEFTGNPEDEAYNVKGQTLGIDTIKGAVNLGLSSFIHYMQGHPTQGDPDNGRQGRNYLRGRNQQGGVVNPCNWEFGSVFGAVDCATIDPFFMYSGDPVSRTGWLNTTATDQRQMSSTGPFTLRAGEAVDIVVAYVAGRGPSAIASVKEAKKIDRAAQFVFNNNFNYPAPPPAVSPLIKTTDNTIELIWNTLPQFNYNQVGNGFDMRFEGYEIKMYNRNSVSDVEAGVQNSVIIGRFDVANDIRTILFEDAITGERNIIWEEGTQLDPNIYSNPATGRISVVIDTDPFTNAPLVKGKSYFISITCLAVNYDEIVLYDALGTYMVPGTAAVGMMTNVPVIFNDDKGNVGIKPGKDTYEPYFSGMQTEHIQGNSTSLVTYNLYEKSLARKGNYNISFDRQTTQRYQLNYDIVYEPTNEIIANDVTNFGVHDISYLYDGVTVNIQWIEPGIQSVTLDEASSSVFRPIAKDTSNTGAFYIGRDLAKQQRVSALSNNVSTAASADLMKRVEIRFGATSKAYRYVKTFSAFNWAGKDDFNDGFVEVPFQAWVVEDNETYQLAVGFTESSFSADRLGNADKIYNPDTNVVSSKEYIIIFPAEYDPNGNNLTYTGTAGVVANFTSGYNLPDDVGVTDSMKTIAKSPFFNAMYLVGLNTKTSDPGFNPTGTLVIDSYNALTPKDKYRYQIKTDYTEDENKALFEKVNVYPNPLYGFNPATSSMPFGRYDEPFVTFNNLPNEITINIYSLDGTLLRTLVKSNTNPEMRWDLKNESELRVASGMYIALVRSPKYGEKVLKFAVVLPQKQIQRY